MAKAPTLYDATVGLLMPRLRVGDCTVAVLRDPFKRGEFLLEIKHDEKRLPERIIFDASKEQLESLAHEILTFTKSQDK